VNRLPSRTARKLRFAGCLFVAGVALAGCAPNPASIAAHDGALRYGAAQYALTPAMRAGVARAVADIVQTHLLLRVKDYRTATISQIKADYHANGDNPPYYCVGLAYEQLLAPTLTHYFRVTPTAGPAGGMAFRVEHSGTIGGTETTPGCGSSRDEAAPFPEAINALNAAAHPEAAPPPQSLPPQSLPPDNLSAIPGLRSVPLR